jgi:GTPase SAR1 family protein
MYYKGASAGMVVYDITSNDSFEGAKGWVKELKAQSGTEIILALVGNKTDIENRREVSTEAARAYA